MPTTTTPAPAGSLRRQALLGMLDRSRLELLVPRDVAVHALAKTFDRHKVGSKHAGLVGAAMTARRRSDLPRPEAERAIRRLIARGQPAYGMHSSADWASRSTSCRACQPAPWQAPTRNPAFAGGPNT